MVAYYNEIDPKAAAWLRELIKQGHIAPGDVDERSISDVKPDDLRGYTQCHFFAGIGVWSYALRRAGWPDDRPVWTGSCPCQPFSSAGKRKGTSDERHLWPHWFHLISQCCPSDVFGEQVASKDGRAWFDTVQSDMEALGFAVGAADLCAAGVGAPHIRQRLWFVAERLADARRAGPQGHRRFEQFYDPEGRESSGRHGSAPSVHGGMGDSNDTGCGEGCERPETVGQGRSVVAANGTQRMADEQLQQRQGGATSDNEARGRDEEPATLAGLCTDNTTRPTNGFWRDADWLGCRDGKFRPVEPGTFPLVDGASARVGRLRGYGNAIVAQVAQTFIEATQGE